MADRTAPYPSYNYIVDIGGPTRKTAGRIFRCFRANNGNPRLGIPGGNEAEPHVRKYPERTKSAT